MTTLDPVIHAPARLRLVVALAQLGEGDTLAFARLQDLLDLTPGNLITHLRKLEEAGYIRSRRSGRSTEVALTARGRAAFDAYKATLQEMLGA